MEYTNIYPNQRQGQSQPSPIHPNNPYFHFPGQQYTSPEQYSFPQQPFNPQAHYQQPQPQSQWQQPQSQQAPSTPRYSHSPQEPPRDSLSPATYNSSDSYLTPSPRSSNPDSSAVWAATSSTRWITPRESPLIGSEALNPTSVWLPSTDFTFNSNGNGNLHAQPNGSGMSAKSATSENDAWATSTAIGKRRRTDEKEKLKAGACKHCKRLKVCRLLLSLSGTEIGRLR
jgi:hypothetical protein